MTSMIAATHSYLNGNRNVTRVLFRKASQMISFRVIDSRIRFIAAAALRFYKLAASYSRLDVSKYNEIHKRERASTEDRFRLVAALALSLTQFAMFDLRTMGRFLIEHFLLLLEYGYLPDDPTGFLNWLGSAQCLVEGSDMSSCKDRWFDGRSIDRHEFENYSFPGDELDQVMQEAVCTQGMSAAIIKEWLATRPDLMQRISGTTPSLLLSSASSEQFDVRNNLISRLLDTLKEGTSCRCTENAKGCVWQDVVAEVNVVFLNDLLDMCHDDGLKLLAADLTKSQELLPRLQPLIDPNVVDELSLRLKAASANRGSEAA